MSAARQTRVALLLGGLAVALGSVGLLPASEGSAQESQQELEEQQEEVRQQRAEIERELERIEAEEAEVSTSIAELEDQLDGQRAKLEEAQRVAEESEQAVRESEAAVADAEQRIRDLEEAADEMVVEAFVNPPLVNGLEVFDSDSVSDATVKQELLRLQADRDADVFDQLEAARQDLEIERANNEQAAAEAEEKRQAVDAELRDLEVTFGEQQELAADLESQLDRRLSEVEALKDVDAGLSRQIEEAAAEFARQLQALAEAQEAAAAEAEVQVPPPPPSGGSAVQPAPGGLVTVSCPTGGSITVAGSIGDNVRRLLDAAAADGLLLCGGGFRDPEAQIALRRAHCGTSDYAVYQMPSSQCTPPTARPGSSMHEQGLAVDFENCSTRSTSCYQWLNANAANFGLFNLPSEPWHWSTNGN